GILRSVGDAKRAMYVTLIGAVVNVTLSATREVALSDEFALPVMVGYTLNPELERTYLVFGVSF
ncbi:MAG: hypothetical protein AAFX41_02535, partial [Bacteroidota bacterium]